MILGFRGKNQKSKCDIISYVLLNLCFCGRNLIATKSLIHKDSPNGKKPHRDHNT